MLWVPVDRSSDNPLYRQIYDQIRAHILNGHIKIGEKLPPTRALASNLGVSRNVIIEAYDQLRAEGFIESRQGASTYVAEGTFLEEFQAIEPAGPDFPIPRTKEDNVIDFRSGIPLLNSFPRKIWECATRRAISEAPDAVFGYGSPEGLPELRHILSRYLVKTRGLRCRPDQIVITTGATQAFTLITRLLLSPETDVVIEDPVTYEIPNIFSLSDCSVVPVPVDEYGMRTDLLPLDKKPGIVFVTPSHQFPIGGTLPIQRRIQLIQFSRKSGCYIVEDDYDSEFCFNSNPVNSLQGLEPEKVIYVGTFSKILSPALRLGYLILPYPLVERCRNLKWYMDLHTSSLEQITLACFIEEMSLERHISAMKKIYKRVRQTLIDSLHSFFPGQVRILGNSAGLHLTAEFQDVIFSEQLIRKALDQGVRIYPVEQHAICKNRHLNRIILGYGNLTQEKVEEGIRRLRTALEEKKYKTSL
ncbi:GntR family transcriptional regulator / MocR family aminotransferase [Desulfotomaculum arcticum]|uniref:GntR family transcriptional regulator / MocR family aminotransferase n=1 Tax=Desulfotruncus arcticus DSM 17038 TaxID=1121424 RepID=A0A1I2W2A4_9FIRM|nr:PLP-dependent aminotransferase family protein [Desulfotruncus arcticus]SFG93661.1 GntR family transcriptional regulator / MocR family aminotransferase [Desulfotomaculum arcticum] [Desulfotruncus arcticus DSM 17038]